MQVGDLVKIVWTEGCVPDRTIVGIVTIIEPYIEGDHQKIELFHSGSRSWFKRGELRVVA